MLHCYGIYVVHFIFYVLHDGYIVVVYVTLYIVLYHRTTSHFDSQIFGIRRQPFGVQLLFFIIIFKFVVTVCISLFEFRVLGNRGVTGWYQSSRFR